MGPLFRPFRIALLLRSFKCRGKDGEIMGGSIVWVCVFVKTLHMTSDVN
jgi:hypothetical protein